MSTQPHNDDYVEQLSNERDCFWRNEVYVQTFDMTSVFGRLAIEANNLETQVRQSDPKLAVRLSKLEDVCLDIGDLLAKKLPLSVFTTLRPDDTPVDIKPSLWRPPIKSDTGEEVKASTVLERKIPDDIRISSIGIRAARKIAKMIPPGELGRFEEMRFLLGDEDMLDTLVKSGFITAEDAKNKEVGFAGVAAALVIEGMKDGLQTLIGSRDKKDRKTFVTAVEKELRFEARRVKAARLPGTAKNLK